MLGRYELIAELLGVGLCLVEDLIELAGKRRLRVRLLGVARHLSPDSLAKLGYADAELLQNRNYDTLILCEQREQQVEVVDERVPCAAREVYCFVEGLRRFDGETVWIDHLSAMLGGRPRCRQRKVQRGCRIKPANLAHLRQKRKETRPVSGRTRLN